MDRPTSQRKPLKGRGALSNPAGRFERQQVEAVDDGWFLEDPPDHIETTLEPDRAKGIISKNDSPDIPFEQSINPYRGCSHGCVYCAHGETPVLMANGTLRPLAELRVGDAIYGTVRQEARRGYVQTRVLAHWSVIKPAYRITLADGTQLTTSGDHRFLTERGWKFVTGIERGAGRRPYLTTGTELMGTGAFAARSPDTKDPDYRRGYLCGLIRGDGQLNPGSPLALCDAEALERAQEWLQDWSVGAERVVLAASCASRGARAAATGTRVPPVATAVPTRVALVRELIGWPGTPTRSWQAGFLAGVFDAAGSYEEGILRVSSNDPVIIGWLCQSLLTFGVPHVIERVPDREKKPVDVVRITGGLREHLRFFQLANPAITRKRDISGHTVQSEARLGIVSIEPLKGGMRLYDITTGTEDFIANGVVSHNCYARPSHAYMGLSAGLDFETRLFYKEDAGRVLEKELARPGYVCKSITLGANTDPYQPDERQMLVTRSILQVLARTRHPVSIISKSALILRDLDILTDLARDNLVSVAISVTTLSNDIKRILEPRAAAPQARLRAVRELNAAGVPTGVMVAPVIPAITDHEMEAILEASAAAGAHWAAYVLLRLPYEVKDLFREWLAQHYPDRASHVMSLVRDMRGGKDYDSRFGSRMRGEGPIAELLRQRFQIACRRLNLNATRRHPLDTALFRPPGPAGAQLHLGL
jgi:DNA repair photolyase